MFNWLNEVSFPLHFLNDNGVKMTTKRSIFSLIFVVNCNLSNVWKMPRGQFRLEFNETTTFSKINSRRLIGNSSSRKAMVVTEGIK